MGWAAFLDRRFRCCQHCGDPSALLSYAGGTGRGHGLSIRADEHPNPCAASHCTEGKRPIPQPLTRGGVMTPEELAEIRRRDSQFSQAWIDFWSDAARPPTGAYSVADRRALLAEVDRLTAALAAAEAKAAASEQVHGYCVCDGNLRARDCGVEAHRDAARALDGWGSL